MPAMKLTPNAAMRARDVSRPHAEHLAQAEAAEAGIAEGSRARTAGPGRGGAAPGRAAKNGPEMGRAGDAAGGPPAGDAAGGPPAGDAGDGRPDRAGFPRRRRGPRDGGRRGRQAR